MSQNICTDMVPEHHTKNKSLIEMYIKLSERNGIGALTIGAAVCLSERSESVSPMTAITLQKEKNLFKIKIADGK